MNGSIMLGKTLKGGHYEKISIRFRSNVSWCGIDVCVDEWGSECGGERKVAHCEYYESPKNKYFIYSYCKIKDLTCVEDDKGISCVKN